MSAPPPRPGTIGWCDLTTGVAEQLMTFYQRVIGWHAQPVDMGGYADYVMADAEGRAVAGICHARGVNAGLPPVWLVYVTVSDLDSSLASCLAEGGAIVKPATSMGTSSRYAIVTDPSGAPVALFEQAPDPAR